MKPGIQPDAAKAKALLEILQSQEFAEMRENMNDTLGRIAYETITGKKPPPVKHPAPPPPPVKWVPPR